MLSAHVREARAERQTSGPWPPPGSCVLRTWGPGHIPAWAPEPTGPARCHCSCFFVPPVTVPWATGYDTGGTERPPAPGNPAAPQRPHSEACGQSTSTELRAQGPRPGRPSPGAAPRMPRFSLLRGDVPGPSKRRPRNSSLGHAPLHARRLRDGDDPTRPLSSSYADSAELKAMAPGTEDAQPSSVHRRVDRAGVQRGTHASTAHRVLARVHRQFSPWDPWTSQGKD